MENPSNRFVVFVHNRPFTPTGGLGDRFAGLISAAGIALQTKRTLLVASTNGFDKLFRPYNSPSKAFDYNNNPDGNYTYANWNSWTSYEKVFNNDKKQVYDLKLCVNPLAGSRKAVLCSMELGDASQAIIKLTSNRAYLCKWLRQSSISVLDWKAMGVREGDNLFEVAGCLLRLAMWPTDLMFEKIASLIDESFGNHVAFNPSAIKPGDDDVILPFLASAHYRCGDDSYDHRHHHRNPEQLTEIEDTCRYEPGSNKTVSDYMNFGTPLDAGNCIRNVLDRFSTGSLPIMRSSSSSLPVVDPQLRRRLRKLESSFHQNRTAVVVVASDNSVSARQINSIVAWPHSVVLPPGCHVEMEQSESCGMLTLTYWFLLTYSDVIAVQTDGGIPISAFPRYAAIYGLKGDILYNGKNCDDALSMHDLSHRTYGNWICES